MWMNVNRIPAAPMVPATTPQGVTYAHVIQVSLVTEFLVWVRNSHSLLPCSPPSHLFTSSPFPEYYPLISSLP